MPSFVADTPAASAEATAAYYAPQARLRDRLLGRPHRSPPASSDFVLLDVRSPALYAAAARTGCHQPSARQDDGASHVGMARRYPLRRLLRRPALQRHRQGRSPSRQARAPGEGHDRRNDRLGRRGVFLRDQPGGGRRQRKDRCTGRSIGAAAREIVFSCVGAIVGRRKR